MALSNRLLLTGTDVNGLYYKIQILQDGATQIEGILGSDICTLDYEPETDSVAGWISPSSANIHFYENSDDISTFLNEILEYQQLDYYVKISSSTDDITYSPVWRGILLQDQIITSDVSRPNLITLMAVDGLSLLKDIEYSTANTITSGIARTKVNDIIRQALQLGLDSEMWSATDPYLTTTNNWWENSLTYSATGDPLESLFFDVVAYKEFVEIFGNYQVSGYTSCYEVIKQFCQVFMMRIYMADGRYYIEQVSERANSNIKRVVYDKTGAQLSAGLVNFDSPLNGTAGSTRLAGNSFGYFPAIKQVKALQKFYPSRGNAQSQFLPTTGALTSSIVKDWGVFDELVTFGTGTVNNALMFETEFSGSILWTPVGLTFNGQVSFWYEVRVKIEFDDVNSATNYYWDDDNQDWVTNSNTFYLRSRPTSYATLLGNGTRTYTNNIPHNFSLTTTNLPATGRVTITLDGIRVRYSQLNATGITTATALQVVGLGGGFTFRLSEFSAVGDNSTFSIATSNLTTIGDNYTVDIGTIEIGDGRTSTGNILPFDGANIQRGGNWARGNGTADKTLGNILVSERLRIQSDVLEMYDGEIQNSSGYAYAITFNGKRYLPLNYSFNAGSCVVTGRWFLIGRDAVVDPDFGGGQNFINVNTADGNGAPKFGKGNFFGDNLFNKNRVGDAIFNDSETDLLNNTRTEKASRGKVLIVEMEASDSLTLTSNDHIILAKWLGTAGTFTLELPGIEAAIYGQQFEIMLNENFTASTNIDLTPNGTDTIEGESSLIINATGGITRFFLRATSDGWY